MLGCGLRRGKVAGLRVADLIGKAAQIRTVPVPDWVKAAIDLWLTSAGSHARPDLSVREQDSIGLGDGITEKVIWHLVKENAARAGIAKLSPHDCRRMPPVVH
jgi:integrase